MKVSTNVHSDEVENNHKEAKIKCQKSINKIFCIAIQILFVRKIIISVRKL